MKSTYTASEALDRYYQIMEEAPALFVSPSPYLRIITDRSVIEEWMRTSDFAIGIVHETPWNIHCVDLVANPDGHVFPYERVLPPDLGKHRGTVMVPCIGKDFILIRIFRHALRAEVLEFPRGINDGISAKANAVKELREEIGADTDEEHVRFLGTVSPNTAFEAQYVDVLAAEIREYHEPQEEEGISCILRVSEAEMEDLIQSGKIVDSFTLSAYLLYIRDRERRTH